MPNRPSIFDISRSMDILDTILTEDNSIDDLTFAVKTVTDVARYMQDTIEEAAEETERLARAALERKRKIEASNARRRKRIEILERKIEDIQSATGTQNSGELIPQQEKLNGRIQKRKAKLNAYVLEKTLGMGIRPSKRSLKKIKS